MEQHNHDTMELNENKFRLNLFVYIYLTITGQLFSNMFNILGIGKKIVNSGNKNHISIIDAR